MSIFTNPKPSCLGKVTLVSLVVVQYTKILSSCDTHQMPISYHNYYDTNLIGSLIILLILGIGESTPIKTPCPHSTHP